LATSGLNVWWIVFHPQKVLRLWGSIPPTFKNQIQQFKWLVVHLLMGYNMSMGTMAI
jgi:hypothetical protein